MADQKLTADTSASPAASNGGVGPAPLCTLVIFWAGCDLNKRFLTPALYSLFVSRLLPDAFRTIGVDPVQQSDDGWPHGLIETMQSFTRDKTAELSHSPKLDDAAWGWPPSTAGRRRLRCRGRHGPASVLMARPGPCTCW